MRQILLACVCICCMAGSVAAQGNPPIELGEEYGEFRKSSPAGNSATPAASGWRTAALYIPNRLLDLLDVIRFDVGVGPSFGAVARVTKWGQIGYRDMEPASLRLGLRGRRFPLFIERSAEFGAGPAFATSPARPVSPVELGIGADAFVAGVYAGIAFDELFDFFGGLVGFDLKDDDLR